MEVIILVCIFVDLVVSVICKFYKIIDGTLNGTNTVITVYSLRDITQLLLNFESRKPLESHCYPCAVPGATIGLLPGCENSIFQPDTMQNALQIFSQNLQ